MRLRSFYERQRFLDASSVICGAVVMQVDSVQVIHDYLVVIERGLLV